MAPFDETVITDRLVWRCGAARRWARRQGLGRRPRNVHARWGGALKAMSKGGCEAPSEAATPFAGLVGTGGVFMVLRTGYTARVHI